MTNLGLDVLSDVRMRIVGGGVRLTPAPPPTGAQPIVLPPLVGASRRDIRERVGRIFIALEPDESGSMHGSWGGDPTYITGAAGRSLLNLADRSGAARAIVIPWGSDAPQRLIVGPVPVRKGKQQLHQALQHPENLGGNNLPLALQRLREKLPPLGPDERLVAFVLTDGIEEVTQAFHDALVALPPDSVHMTLLDRHNGCSPEWEQRWRDTALASVTRITDLTVTNLAHQLARIYAEALGLQLGTTTTTGSRRTR